MSARTKIAILADSPVAALRAGAQGRGAGQGATWLPPLAQAFEAYDDLDITWIALEQGIQEKIDERHHGQRFIALPHIKKTYDTLLNYLPARLRLKNEIRKIQPQVVHVWGSEHYYPSVLPGLGVPSVYSIQGNMTHYAKVGALPDNWYWRKQWRYEGGWIPHASVVACESPWSREIALANWPQIDVRDIEWGVHPSFYEVKWQPDMQRPYLLFCGAIDWRKGIDVLFDALALLPDRNWSIRLAGEGSLRGEMESRGLPKVEWLGNLKWDELKRQMAGASGLVVPTRADTGPSVVKEARVIGLPVIASCHGGLRDYIKPGVNGLHIDPLDAATLAKAMSELMSDPELIQRLGAGQHEGDRAYFRPERAARSFHDLYLELAK
ncbi:glycosyltransferase family 4 protein [Haloferula sp. BvORR071]|uniref:glycosyltransferase family 4 protein n=1 Tax=Haloferula sp. BvORR071 TaxID=1396141 RepID=UPI00054E03ED|nr:glycosyltransferase family 4 protein [Haloferula sp. BvORR071]